MRNRIIFLLFVFVLANGFLLAQSKIKIKKAWLRPAARDMNSALFFEIVNNGDKPDTLIEAQSKIAGDVMIHESYSKGNDMMGMRMLKFVAVPPHALVKFKPKGLHVMIMDLNEELKIGQTKEFTLVFRKAGKVKVKAAVRDVPES